MKKTLCLLLALALVLSGSALAVEFDNSNGYPVVNEPVSFSILARQFMYHVDWDEMDLWIDYEAMTGVHIDWILVPTESFTEKRNLTMAANELPDAIMIAGLSNAQMVQYGEDGLLTDFAPLLQYMPALSAALEKYPQVKAGITMPNGAIYGMPGIFDDGFLSLMVGNHFYARSSFLDALDMEAPTTVDELTAFLQGVKDNDVDGDGDPTNEIPLSGWNSVGSGAFRGFIYQLYGAYGLGNLGTSKHPALQLEEDGTLSFLPATDEYKEVLTLMKQWYDAGFFPAEMLTMDSAENSAMLGENKTGVVLTLSASMFTTDPTIYVGLGPMKGPYGQSFVNQNPPLANVGTFVITADCKEPELLAAWVDWFYSEPGIIKFFMGTEGKTFDIVDGQYVYQDWITNDPDGRVMDELIGTFSAYPGGGAPRIVLEQFFSGTQKQPDAMESAKLYADYFCPTIAPDFTYTLEESSELITLSDLTTYWQNMMTGFITGTESLDNWDAYLAELDKLGVERYLEIETAAYTRYRDSL